MNTIYKRILSLCFALLLLPSPLVGQTTDPYEGLQLYIESIIDDEEFFDAHWGVLVVDPATGDTLFARNHHRNFVPASNVKLYTAASALSQLGPDFRYITEVWSDGTIDDGAVRGNIVIRGSGDPTIGGRAREDEEPTYIFEQWADTLRQNGIERVEGAIIGDNRALDNTPLGLGWSWSDVPTRFAAEVNGLVFNENVVEFELEGTSPGQPANVTWEPYNTSFIEVRNETTTVSSNESTDIDYHRGRADNVFRHKSQLRPGNSINLTLSITQPAQYFSHVLKETFERSGIEVRGPALDIEQAAQEPTYEGPNWRRHAIYMSPPLSEIVEHLNKDSQNLYAEQVLRTLGAHRPVLEEDIDPASSEMGIKAAERTYELAGINIDGMRLVDGSGLSRYNLLSPVMTIDLLHLMHAHEDDAVRDAFYDSLPIGGMDGTLEYRFQASPARGNVRAKTGTLSGVSALSGYVDSATGNPLIFSIKVNNYSTSTSSVRNAQNDIVDALATFPN